MCIHALVGRYFRTSCARDTTRKFFQVGFDWLRQRDETKRAIISGRAALRQRAAVRGRGYYQYGDFRNIMKSLVKIVGHLRAHRVRR